VCVCVRVCACACGGEAVGGCLISGRLFCYNVLDLLLFEMRRSMALTSTEVAVRKIRSWPML